ncbi:MAG: helix-turn-helix transcriptional regulator, partial [Mycobacteriaceae bacterium]|nr:helix-turn-helix transcriptional regulator [Mycobacteriaceae bacterium]
GIATNLLAQRLSELEGAGVIERTDLPPPIARTVYSLSDTGWRLGLPILGALARFGLETTQLGTPGSRSPLNGFLVGVLLGFDRVRAQGVAASYRVQIDGRRFDFAVSSGRLGAARAEPDVTLTASASDLVSIRFGSTATRREAALRRLRFDGEDNDVDAMRTIFQLTGESVSASTS